MLGELEITVDMRFISVKHRACERMTVQCEIRIYVEVKGDSHDPERSRACFWLYSCSPYSRRTWRLPPTKVAKRVSVLLKLQLWLSWKSHMARLLSVR